ncbi:MAG: hypothetical protein EOO15_04280 [Chitinophagaceae bacterium]|nr:MAG: hypothetical protein EOO15_04280 [Chitinophagaceae bacterium]
MRYVLSLLIGILAFAVAGAQTSVDQYVSIDFPGVPTKVDNVAQGIPMRTLTLRTDTAIYVAMRMELEKAKRDKNILPGDTADLHRIYKGYLNGMDSTIKANGIVLRGTQFFIRDSLHWVRTYFERTEDGVRFGENNAVLLGNQLYAFSYYNFNGFEKGQKTAFLRTVRFAKEHPAQFSGMSGEERKGYLFGKLIGYAVIGAGILFLVFRKRKGASAGV